MLKFNFLEFLFDSFKMQMYHIVLDKFLSSHLEQECTLVIFELSVMSFACVWQYERSSAVVDSLTSSIWTVLLKRVSKRDSFS